MINPTKADIGRRVVYIGFGQDTEGVITSFNDDFVFVRYGRDTGSQATRRADLEWVTK